LRSKEVELSAATGAPAPCPRRKGFSIVELVIVLVVTSLVLGIAGLTFTDYFDRSSARRAAQVFARDLSFARSSALRSRDRVVIRFDETDRWYEVAMQDGGNALVTRRFGSNADVVLRAIDLRMDGDTVVVDSRGVVDLAGIVGTGSLGEARFASGSKEYSVYFNSMGASKVEER